MAATKQLDAEIIVVDNNSQDDSCDMVERLFPQVKLIKNPENSGFSKGNNLGVKQATGEFLCILNPDTVVAEDTFSSLIEAAENLKDFGILGCRLIDGTGKFLPESKRNIPTPLVSIKKILGFTKGYYASKVGETETAQVDILVGAFMLMKRSLYEQISGFDEDYFMYGEDVDLSYRALKAGYKNYYVGAVTAVHFKGESTLKDKRYAQRFYGAMQVFYKKHFKNQGVFDLAVWVGSRLLPYLKNEELPRVHRPKQYIWVGNKAEEIERVSVPVIQKESVDDFQPQTEYILDNNMLAFKTIIQYIEKPTKSQQTTFKIRPVNARFIVGSNSSKSKGEVLHLK